MVGVAPPTRAYVHGLRGGDDVDLQLVWAVGEVESEGCVDLSFCFAVGVLERLGDVGEAGDEIPDLGRRR
jgi:hypothetical protein